MSALILSIETATPICSVALHKDGKLLAFKETTVEKSHAKLLTVYIEALLDEAKVRRGQLSAVAVSMGPGSYTGLRIGASTAKGIAYALDIPVIGVDTLKAMAYGALEKGTTADFIVPMIDARRMEVYHAVFDHSLSLQKAVQPLILEKGVLDELCVSGTVLCCGDGSEKAYEVFEGIDAVSIDDTIGASARWLGALAFKKYKEQSFEDTAYFEPFYMKEAHTTVSKKQPLKS